MVSSKTTFILGLPFALLCLYFTFLALTTEVSLRSAEVAFKHKNYDGALAFLHKPWLGDYRLAQRTGQLLLAKTTLQGQAGNALPAFALAVEQNPLNAELYYDLGWLQLAKLETFLAEQTFTKALELDPNNATYLYGLGFAKEKNGHEEQAIALYQQALTLRETPKIRQRLERLTLSFEAAPSSQAPLSTAKTD